MTIEKLVYGGDGLARIESEGRRKAVFVPLVLPGERVEASIAEDRGGFLRARLERVVEPAMTRTAPPCPYFGECGGCHYQHATYEAQLKFKQDILRETVARIAKVELPEIQVHASEPLHYRNRTRARILQVELSPVAAGARVPDQFYGNQQDNPGDLVDGRHSRTAESAE